MSISCIVVRNHLICIVPVSQLKRHVSKEGPITFINRDVRKSLTSSLFKGKSQVKSQVIKGKSQVKSQVFRGKSQVKSQVLYVKSQVKSQVATQFKLFSMFGAFIHELRDANLRNLDPPYPDNVLW